MYRFRFLCVSGVSLPSVYLKGSIPKASSFLFLCVFGVSFPNVYLGVPFPLCLRFLFLCVSGKKKFFPSLSWYLSEVVKSILPWRILKVRITVHRDLKKATIKKRKNQLMYISCEQSKHLRSELKEIHLNVD